MKKLIFLLIFFLTALPVRANIPLLKATNTPTLIPTPTFTTTPPLPTNTPTETATPTETPTPTSTPEGITPNSPLCAEHDNNTFHTLLGENCHYDHEHGTDPFTSEVSNTFPGFDLFSLLGNVEIGHTNPSSEMENSHKHGGFKWDVTLSHSAGCTGGGSVAPIGVNALVVEYHNFGNYIDEFEARVHSSVALLRQCKTDNPNDFGYAFFNQWQDFGQRLANYQGIVLSYSDTPNPAYNSPNSPYMSVLCFGNIALCDKYASRQAIITANANGASTWIGVPNSSVGGSTLFNFLFRVRDTYQALDGGDLTYPFTFVWLCSNDNGQSYSPGCRYNNSTSRVHEIHGEIPVSWDNSSIDSNSTIGRITAEGFVTSFGTLNPSCTSAGPDCHPFKLINAFVGKYFSAFALDAGKGSFAPENLPERDVYFCNSQLCSESSQGAVSSGWIGEGN